MTVLDHLPGGGTDGADLDPFLERAAAWAAELTIDDIPPPVRRAATAQLVSTVGAAIWTRTHPLGEAIDRAVDTSPAGQATFLGEADTSPAAAACGNAALSMALDFDDTILGGHTGHSSVFVPIAYGETTGASGDRVLVGQVAANEIGARLAAAAAVGPFRGQQTAYVHAVGATVGRAVVEQAGPEVMADALGTALLQPPWPLEPPFLGADAKVWSASEPIRTGLNALTSARAGLSGRPDLVEDRGGFLATFADLPLPEFLGDLGRRWHTRALTVKSVPGCAYVTAPIEAALTLHDRLGPGETRIDRVDVHGSLFTTEVDERARRYIQGPETPVAALSFSVPFNVAAALADGEHTPRQVGERVGDETLWRLATRVSVHHDEEFTMAALDSAVPVGAMLRRVGLPVLGYSVKTVGLRATVRHLPTLARFARKRPLPTDLSTADKRMGARVTVTTADGRTETATVEHPSGFAGHPLDDIEAVARRKGRAGLEATGIPQEMADQRVDELLRVEQAQSLSLAPLISEGHPA